jgi:peptidoglycan/LPS O-acetylase OafA/YrhL
VLDGFPRHKTIEAWLKPPFPVVRDLVMVVGFCSFQGIFSLHKSIAIPRLISSGTRIPELDGARGIAVLIVVVAHYFLEVEHGFAGFNKVGWMGVALFFVLSGFLIGSIILERKDSPNFFSVFYIRRALRIFPVYFATLALTFGFMWLLPSLNDEPMPVLSYLTFTQNFAMALRGSYGAGWLAPTWTVAVEEQFYLVIPLIIVSLPKRWLLPAIIGGILLCSVARALLYWTGNEIAGQVTLLSGGNVLLSGVLAAHVHQRYPAVSEKALRMIPLAAVAGLLFVEFQTFATGWNLYFVTGPLLIAAVFVAYVLLAARGRLPFRFLRWRFLQVSGTISYGLYLVHQPVAGVVHGLILGTPPDIATGPQVAVTFASLFAAIGLVWASWTLMESPLLRVGRQWQYKTEPPAALNDAQFRIVV